MDGHEGRFQYTFKVASQRSVSVKRSQWWILRDYFFAAVDEAELLSVRCSLRFPSASFTQKSWFRTRKNRRYPSLILVIVRPWVSLQWLEVIQHVKMTAEVEFVDSESAIPAPSFLSLSGNFTFVERGDMIPLSRQLLISTVRARPSKAYLVCSCCCVDAHILVKFHAACIWPVCMCLLMIFKSAEFRFICWICIVSFAVCKKHLWR